MPGIAQGYSMAAAQAIDTALRLQFPKPDEQKDARRVHELMGEAGLWEDLMLENAIIGVRLTVWLVAFVASFAPPLYPLWGVLVIGAERYQRRWSARHMMRKRAEFKMLVLSDPARWEPIVREIKEIIRVHGNATHMLLGRRDVVALNE